MLVIACIYVVRLFSLQVLNDDYKQHADGNAFLKKTQYPSRGLIYDRNGKLLVFNQPAYDVMMIVREVRPFDTLDFCRTVGITKEQFDKRMADMKNRRLNPGYSSYTPQTFMTQLSAQDMDGYKRNYIVSLVFSFKTVCSGSMLTLWLRMYWGIFGKCLPEI